MKIQNIHLKGVDTEQGTITEREVEKILCSRGFAVNEGEPDLLITIGGDGTYLYHMRDMNFPTIPTIGVNAGTLGYYQELKLSEFELFADDLQKGNFQLKRRSLLDVEDLDGNVLGTALNEIYVSRNSARSMKAKLMIERGEFARFVGDGIIFTTTQGSTAYAAAAGGPMLAEELPVYAIVPSNAHDTTLYESIRAPLVLPEDAKTIVTIHSPEERPVIVQADGNTLDIDITKPFAIKTSDRHLEVLRTQRFDYFERLAYKLVHRR